MFSHICVPVDNSEHSNRAIDLAVELGRAFGSRLTGCHVYAARLHDHRFKQMEYTLPEEYREEQELERQRKVHDSLIAKGLKLISDSYLDVMAEKAQTAGLQFERKTFDGKHYKVLAEDVRGSDYDLVIMGALGMGAVKDSQLGSVTERFVRKVTVDTLVVKDLDPGSKGAIVVCLDGSPHSFNGLRLGIALGKALNRPVEAAAVYDPYMHYAMFKGIAGVLSEKASKVFRFKEQEQLHEEIIDAGLAKIYQSHLEIGRRLAGEEGVDLGVTLLDGKCFEKILQYCRASEPWLLVLGRVGVHSGPDETDLGSNAENLLRLAPCNVLLTGGKFSPPLDLRAEATITWTEEAEARMERIPSAVRGIARTSLKRYAIEKGHTVITSGVIDEALAAFAPGPAGRKMQAPAGDPAVIEAMADREGAAVEEEVMPGVVVRWSAEAREALGEVTDPYLRRRAKALVEKQARSRKVPIITPALALPLIEETAGRDKLGPGWEALIAKTKLKPADAPGDTEGSGQEGEIGRARSTTNEVITSPGK